MRTRLLAVVALGLVTGFSFGAELLKNGDFAQAAPGKPAVPANWMMPAGEHWQRMAKGGPNGGSCLHFTGGREVPDPVRGSCDYLTPGGRYELKVMARTDGHHAPFLRIFDVNEQRELVRMMIPRDPVWGEATVAFKAATANVVVELYADLQRPEGVPTPAGNVWIARVEVAPLGDAAASGGAVPDLGENLALGRPYTMTKPSYRLCADPDDQTQLTDGIYTKGHFWTRKTTVGWGGRNPPLITIDLGKDYPIKGLSCNTAGGVADVRWPTRIQLFTSPDGAQWYQAGDLVQLSGLHAKLPAYGEYAVHRLWTDQLTTHGRYIALQVEPGGTFTFLDEIEVYLGDKSFLTRPYTGPGHSNLEEHLAERKISDLIQAQFRRDLAAVQSDIDRLPLAQRVGLAARATALAKAIHEMPTVPMENFRAVLPMTDLERDIFRLQAAVWRTQGKSVLRIWSGNRWDPLAPSDEPGLQNAAPVVDVHMMRNEFRAGVFNLTNAAAQDLTLRLRLTGLPGGSNPTCVRVHQVEHVGTLRFTSVAAALPEARRVGDDYLVTVPTGMTRQVWLTFRSHSLAAGLFSGRIEIRGKGVQVDAVPIRLRVYPLRFPDKTTLCVGGWSYSNNEKMYGLTTANRDALITHLKEHYVNAPWASSKALPSGTYDQAGAMLTAPDTSNFDSFAALWPKAKIYMVFLAVRDQFCGSEIGTDGFNAKVGNWAHFWADHMRGLGLAPSQLGLLIYDEPHDKEAYDIITAWARAIEAAEPELVTWEDPQPKENKDCLEMFASVDVLCPYRNPFLSRDQWYRDLFLEQQRQGRELWFYNADGPARSFDPFSFYLLQEWHAFKIGAKGSCFWAFADTGREKNRRTLSCWNEYPGAGNGPYCPVYLDATSVTAAKYMEAIREGVQDYEYLTMLRKRVAECAAQGVAKGDLAAAKTLLATACDRVLSGEKGSNYRWDETKDRTIADTVRIEILQALTVLGK